MAKRLTLAEEIIYATTFAMRMDARIERGIAHSPFSKSPGSTGHRVAQWERWCVDCAIEDAEAYVTMHREGRKRCPRR